MDKSTQKSCNISKKTSIGGMALIEGIMMRGPKKSAMAVRNPKGEIIVEEWKTKSSTRSKFFKLPLVRGVFNFVDSMVSGYKTLMRSAEIAGLDDMGEKENGEEQNSAEDEKSESKASKGSSALMNTIMVLSSVLGVVLALFLFVYLPSLLSKWILGFTGGDNNYLRSVLEGVFKIIILVAYMLAVSLMKDIRRTFMYHGAEHKSIFCYEQGLELTVENVRMQRRFHPRCGTSFIILMVLVSIFVSLFIPISIVWLRVLIKILLLPIIMGIGYELLKLAGRKDNLFTKIISAPGMWLQHITTVEPDDDMIECAITALKKVIPNDESDNW